MMSQRSKHELVEHGNGIDLFTLPKDQRTSDYGTGRFG
jgi:ABC-type phosphate transport system ATPase subunit